MKIDEDCQEGIKILVFILCVIGLISLVVYLISCAVKAADAYRRSEMEKDMALYKANGCVIAEVKYNDPVYKCGVKNDD